MNRYYTTRRVQYRGVEQDVRELNMETVLRDVGIAIVVALILTFFWPFRSVPTGSRGVLTQFGAIKVIEPEGLALVLPWQGLQLFSIRAEAADIEKATGATSDTQPVFTDLTVRYSIQPDKVAEVYEQYSHNGDLQSYVQTATQEVFKAVTARYTAPDLIAKRQQVSNDILDALRLKLSKYGAQVINIDMRNFAFSDTYMHAINDKVTQEQLRLAAENKVKTVEAEQKQKVAVAEAEANALKAKADGEAYATIAQATAQSKGFLLQQNAQAEAIKNLNSALAAGKDVLELRRIEVERAKADKWDGKLPEAIYAGTPIPFLQTQK